MVLDWFSGAQTFPSVPVHSAEAEAGNCSGIRLKNRFLCLRLSCSVKARPGCVFFLLQPPPGSSLSLSLSLAAPCGANGKNMSGGHKGVIMGHVFKEQTGGEQNKGEEEDGRGRVEVGGLGKKRPNLVINANKGGEKEMVLD